MYTSQKSLVHVIREIVREDDEMETGVCPAFQAHLPALSLVSD